MAIMRHVYSALRLLSLCSCGEVWLALRGEDIGACTFTADAEGGGNKIASAAHARVSEPEHVSTMIYAYVVQCLDMGLDTLYSVRVSADFSS